MATTAIEGSHPLRPIGVELRGIHHAYGKGIHAKTILDDCSLSFEPGKLTVVVGPSGCEKFATSAVPVLL